MLTRPALRRALLAGACLSLSAVALTVPTTGATADGRADSRPSAGRDEAPRRAQVVGRGDGRAVARTQARTPASAAEDYAGRYALRWGVDVDALEVGRVTRSAGGHVVRLQQTVDGLPVIGGDVVMSLSSDRSLRRASARLADEVSLPAARLTDRAAESAARRAIASRQERRASTLDARGLGQWVFDASLFGAPGPEEPRRVHRVEVSGDGLLRTVLVDSLTGRILADVDEHRAALNRVVCDGSNSYQPGACRGSTLVRRTEKSGPSGDAEVDQAFAAVGATASFWQQVAGVDLTALIGTGSTPALQTWTRVCDDPEWDPTCPMANAFWSEGTMRLGQGFAAADDVVAHEMTHGVISATSDLFYFYQSGAINESLADVIGEIVDHRFATPGDSPTSWDLGEAAPGGALRDLAEPWRHQQPDRMTSGWWSTTYTGLDNGYVHTNSGVGNKVAYLISQGGDFNGVTVGAGIDAGDPDLTKTGTLFTQVIPRLSSSADYADLADALQSTCTELAAVAAGGFTADDCATVDAAVAATELRLPPTEGAPPAEAPSTCPEGTTMSTFYRNSGSLSGLVSPEPSLWFSVPEETGWIPTNARSGVRSLFAYDPSPAWGDPVTSSITTSSSFLVPSGRETYLHFAHWRFFWSNHGGKVQVLVEQPDGSFKNTALPQEAWVNGPEPILDGNALGFGGTSMGWTSSRLDLSSLAGSRVKLRWLVDGHGSDDSALGWYLDDIALYSCGDPVPPGAVTKLVNDGRSDTRTRLSWSAPTYVGGGVTGYRVTRSDGQVTTLPSTARTRDVSVPNLAGDWSWTVTPIGIASSLGPGRTTTVHAPRMWWRSYPSRARKGVTMTFSGRVRTAGSTLLPVGFPVDLQRRTSSGSWKVVTDPNGTVRRVRVGTDGRWTVTAKATGAPVTYRVQFTPARGWLSAATSAVTVRRP